LESVTLSTIKTKEFNCKAALNNSYKPLKLRISKNRNTEKELNNILFLKSIGLNYHLKLIIANNNLMLVAGKQE